MSNFEDIKKYLISQGYNIIGLSPKQLRDLIVEVENKRINNEHRRTI